MNIAQHAGNMYYLAHENTTRGSRSDDVDEEKPRNTREEES